MEKLTLNSSAIQLDVEGFKELKVAASKQITKTKSNNYNSPGALSRLSCQLRRLALGRKWKSSGRSQALRLINL